MLPEYLRTENIILWLFVTYLAGVAIVYLGRLLLCLAGKGKPKYEHDVLLVACLWWAFCLGMSDITPIILFMLGLLLFSVFCAILQIKVSGKKTWKLLWEDSMNIVIAGLDGLRNGMSKASALWKGISPLIKDFLFVCAFIIFAFWVTLSPQTIPILGVLIGLALLYTALCQCLHSCRKLLLFWLFYSGITAGVMYSWLSTILPQNTVTDLFVYAALCLFLTLFWCLSAGIADYDVAQMAGKIINTGSTILLVAVNVFVGWMQGIPILQAFTEKADPLYEFNLVLLPIVISGCLAMLFVDGIAYYRKKFNQETDEG